MFLQKFLIANCENYSRHTLVSWELFLINLLRKYFPKFHNTHIKVCMSKPYSKRSDVTAQLRDCLKIKSWDRNEYDESVNMVHCVTETIFYASFLMIFFFTFKSNFRHRSKRLWNCLLSTWLKYCKHIRHVF